MIYPSRHVQIEYLQDFLSNQKIGVKSRFQKDTKLVGTPALLPGESLSSWAHRIRAHLKIKPRTFRKIFHLKLPLSWLDVGGGSVDLDFISRLVLQPVDELNSLRWPKFSKEDLYILTCLTTLPLARGQVLRYCENCLREDKTPYFRQFWRFTFSYLCPLHGSVLRDSCPHCRGDIDTVYRDEPVNLTPLSICPHCFRLLSEVDSVELPKELTLEVLHMQLQLANLVNPGAEFLMSSLGVRRSGQYDFVRNSDVIDLSILHNARKLYMSMLSLNLPTVPVAKGLKSHFSPFLTMRDIGSKRDVPLGLDGWCIFGNKAGILPLYLSKAQKTVNHGTFWWSIDHQEEIFQMMPGSNKDDWEAAVSWMLKLALR